MIILCACAEYTFLVIHIHMQGRRYSTELRGPSSILFDSAPESIWCAFKIRIGIKFKTHDRYHTETLGLTGKRQTWRPSWYLVFCKMLEIPINYYRGAGEETMGQSTESFKYPATLLAI